MKEGYDHDMDQRMLVIMVVQKEKKETLVARTQSSASNGFSKTVELN